MDDNLPLCKYCYWWEEGCPVGPHSRNQKTRHWGFILWIIYSNLWGQEAGGRKWESITSRKSRTRAARSQGPPSVKSQPPFPLGKTRIFLSRDSSHTFKNVSHLLNLFREKPPKMERAKTTRIVFVQGVGHNKWSGKVRPRRLHVADRTAQGLRSTRSKINLT